MGKIIASNDIGQLTIKHFKLVKTKDLTNQEFLDKVNDSIDYDINDPYGYLSLDYSEWGQEAKKELEKVDTKAVYDIIKDYNTITMLQIMADEKGDREMSEKLMNFVGILFRLVNEPTYEFLC